jgi:hypothetical protein
MCKPKMVCLSARQSIIQRAHADGIENDSDRLLPHSNQEIVVLAVHRTIGSGPLRRNRRTDPANLLRGTSKETIADIGVKNVSRNCR